MTDNHRKVLILSDGHGEDWVGVQLALALRSLLAVEVTALPLVGEGELYRQKQVPVLGGQWLPSGGFTFKHWPAFWQDMTGGLIPHSWQILQETLRHARQIDLILAVGDVLPLALAWQVGKPYVFVGCTKSDYYSPGRSCYFWPERVLMQTKRCYGTFTRDKTTAQHLSDLGVRAEFLGNPMMDGLGQATALPDLDRDLHVGILPGSRPGETQANLTLLLACAHELQTLATTPITFMAAIAPGLNRDSFIQPALQRGWIWQDPYLILGSTRVWLRTGAFAEVLGKGHLFMAMAGTATEQAVGLGRPVITIPGDGPQFTRRFAALQCQLLGESILLCPSPAACAQAAWQVLQDPVQLARIQHNGLIRMGRPGAAREIATQIAPLIRGFKDA